MAVNKKIPMRKCVGCGEMKPKKNCCEYSGQKPENSSWMHLEKQTAEALIFAGA